MSQAEADAAAASAQRAAESQLRAEAQGMVDRAIAVAKAQLGYELDKKKLQLSAPIKELGTTMVPIKLHPKVTGELKVVVKEA